MKKYKKHIIYVSIFLCIFLFCLIIKSNTTSAEFYTRYISNNIQLVIGSIFSILPFSVYEIGLVVIIITIVVLVVKLFRALFKKVFEKALSHLLLIINILVTAVVLEFAIGSVPYNRYPVDIKQINNEEVTEEMIIGALRYYVDDYNNISRTLKRKNDHVIMPYSYRDLNKVLKEEYKKLSKESKYFSPFTPRIKKLWFSEIYSQLHITGFSFASTAEAHINFNISTMELPFVMAHELAHVKGVTREDDANLTALYICLNSEDIFLRYSAYYWGVSSLIDAYQTTFRKSYYPEYRLDDEIYREISLINKYYEEHDLLSRIGNFFNDLYLKLNGNENGTDDYVDSSDKVDTGEKDDKGETIYKITNYSPFQKVFYYNYLHNVLN